MSQEELPEIIGGHGIGGSHGWDVKADRVPVAPLGFNHYQGAGTHFPSPVETGQPTPLSGSLPGVEMELIEGNSDE